MQFSSFPMGGTMWTSKIRRGQRTELGDKGTTVHASLTAFRLTSLLIHTTVRGVQCGPGHIPLQDLSEEVKWMAMAAANSGIVMCELLMLGCFVYTIGPKVCEQWCFLLSSWGRFSCPFVLMKINLNATAYHRILNKCAFHYLFQHDSAPVHKASSRKKWVFSAVADSGCVRDRGDQQ